ncbi:MAG: hypothetical protein CVU39_17795 [Chloroflexi bacterium HGW-Chloroflexi-10]|nr:MAG: hypothetical protein CVU39_17795 [Chloroflexi bacterium HGW-Chloroflexi-10]
MVKKLLAINGLAIICVILFHASGWGFTSLFWWTHRYLPVEVPNFDQLGSLSYYSLRFVEQLIIFAIPTFLFVSGYFIAFATGKNQNFPKIVWLFNRLIFLIVPFLLWSVLTLIFKALLGEIYTPLQYMEILFTGKAAETFYFIPLLVQLYIISPLLTRLARKWPWILLAGTLLLLLVIRGMQYLLILNIHFSGEIFIRAISPSWMLFGGLFWFSLGIVVGFNLNAILAKLSRWRWVFLCSAILLIPAGIWEWETLLANSGRGWFPTRETILDALYALMVLGVFLSFPLKQIAKSKWLNYLGSKSFGIYLSHTLVLTLTAKLIYNFAPQILGWQWLFQPILILLGLSIPILIMEITERTFLKRWYAYIFG